LVSFPPPSEAITTGEPGARVRKVCTGLFGVREYARENRARGACVMCVRIL